MPSSAWALQKAIFQTLTGDAALVALIGGTRLYDNAPQSPAFPYLTFALSETRDWDTGTEPGDEHLLTLHVWSRDKGRGEAHAIMDRIRTLLHDQTPGLDGHRCVNLRHEFSEARREPDGDTMRGITRYRAVTEPLP